MFPISIWDAYLAIGFTSPFVRLKCSNGRPALSTSPIATPVCVDDAGTADFNRSDGAVERVKGASARYRVTIACNLTALDCVTSLCQPCKAKGV